MIKEKVGVIDGTPIYIDSGPDYVDLMREAVRRRMERKKLKEGQVFYMAIDFDQGERFVIEMKVHADDRTSIH